MFERMAIINDIENDLFQWEEVNERASPWFHLPVEERNNSKLCPVDSTFEECNFDIHTIQYSL